MRRRKRSKIPETTTRAIGYISFNMEMSTQRKYGEHCRLCPRECGVDRDHGPGFCGIGNDPDVASITIHHGEEPVISGADGICNVFFSGCNLRCVYCQNHQISRATGRISTAVLSVAGLVDKIAPFLDRGIENVGFVSPSHMVPQVAAIVGELHRRRYFPIVVYNTNAYEKVETLRELEGLVDVYLPDFKYRDGELAARWSGAADYPQVAGAALREMYRQKGNRLRMAESGKASSGLIVRHLVLPGAVANSLDVIRFLASELSPRLALSLMSQYRPTPDAANLPPLNRTITLEEYRRVADLAEALGFENGWLQEFDSPDHYNPDFTRDLPFQV